MNIDKIRAEAMAEVNSSEGDADATAFRAQQIQIVLLCEILEILRAIDRQRRGL